MSRKQRKRGECAYCGTVAELTIDHVIPQCLFTKPLPPDMVKVSACEQCNNTKSKDDDFLRDFLVTDIFASEQPTAKAIFTQKVVSSARQNKSALMRSFKSHARLEPLHTRGGIYLGHAYSAPLDGERVTQIFCRIMRGLYYKIRSQRIPDKYKCEVSRWEPTGFNEFWPTLKQIGFNGPYHCGDVFTCIMLYADEDPFITAWWLCFYDRICIHVSTELDGFE